MRFPLPGRRLRAGRREHRGKAILEKALSESGLGYAIVRPTVVFGAEGILINNIAWLLRRFPVFAVPGDGSYRLQPVFVEDLADLLVSAGERTERDVVLTPDEVRGLMAGLLVSGAPPTAKTRLSQWLEQHRSTIGGRYASELRRHYRQHAQALRPGIGSGKTSRRLSRW